MAEQDIDAILEITNDLLCNYLKWQPVLRREWTRQKERSQYGKE